MRKGVSPAVSYVLLLAIIVIVSVATYVWGDYEIRRLQDTPIAHNMESQMISIDELVTATSHGDTNFTVTMNVYYAKGVMQAGNGLIKYTAELNADVYDRVTDDADDVDGCDDATIILQDSATGIKMTRMQYTNVYRGSTGDEQKQLVEIVACFPGVQIDTNAACAGKSGPRAQLTAKKTGFNAGTGEPIVEVRVC